MIGRSALTRLTFAFLAVVVLSRPASGQITTATISGSVKDGTGAVLPGATVTLVSDEPDKLLLSPSEDKVGSKSITVTFPAGGTSTRYYLQALAQSGTLTYTATGLVSWVNAGPQTPATPPLVDNIDHGTRVNGTAVLRIAFSDGSEGVLTVGCHGPGAPPGIFEGIATTKGFTTYYDVPDPVPGVDAGRTNFHVR